MRPQPQDEKPGQRGGDRLRGRVAIVSGADSGIGRAVELAFAREGADVAVLHLEEREDARETRRLVEERGQRCLLIEGDVGDPRVCRRTVERTLRAFGRIDIVVDNAAQQHSADELTAITAKQLERTFRTNVFGMFFSTQAALPHLEKGASIINTTSVTAYRGSPKLIDYASTKGAIGAFTRSLSGALAESGIRVNAVAPRPIWTPLIPASFAPKKVAEFGSDVPMRRAGEPAEVAPCFVFLASDDASYMTGQVMHPNGGEVVNR